jgi:hypothetical protein
MPDSTCTRMCFPVVLYIFWGFKSTLRYHVAWIGVC